MLNDLFEADFTISRHHIARLNLQLRCMLDVSYRRHVICQLYFSKVGGKNYLFKDPVHTYGHLRYGEWGLQHKFQKHTIQLVTSAKLSTRPLGVVLRRAHGVGQMLPKGKPGVRRPALSLNAGNSLNRWHTAVSVSSCPRGHPLHFLRSDTISSWCAVPPRPQAGPAKNAS